MQSNNPPLLIPTPWANNGSKNTIPATSQIGITPGAASWPDGFPPLTMTPLAAGGVPPSGQDFNGLGFALSSPVQWLQAGGPRVYNATWATQIGGYPKGARVTKADFSGEWLNTVDGNVSNPDTGGAGWVDATAGRFLKATLFLVSGTFTWQTITKLLRIRLWSGGGGGSGATGTSGNFISGGGGGGGGYIEWIGSPSLLGTTSVNVIIGSGGAAGAVNGNGGNGGASSVGSVISITGGTAAVIGMGGGNGGVPSSTAGQQLLAITGGRGQGSFLSAIPGIGGGAFGSQGGVPHTTAGDPGLLPGGGGAGGGNSGVQSGSTQAFAGGAGASGFGVIEELG